MPDRHLLTADTALHTGERLPDSLRRWRDADLREADRPAASEPLAPALRAVDANRVTIEHAKGALMLRYGIDSHQAFGVIVRWAQVARTPVSTIAEALVHGICEGNPQTELRHRPLMRWLEDQLRRNDPDLVRLPATPA